jgi:proteasome lid subunit RPN8/RPN11
LIPVLGITVYVTIQIVDAIHIAQPVLLSLLAESRRDPTRECCGLLAGNNAAITTIFPAHNIHPAPATAYEIAPKELFRLFREIRAQGLDLLGIYHSHPTGDNSPSPTDIERAYYADAAYFIICPRLNAKKHVRAFRIRDGRSDELEIEVI